MADHKHFPNFDAGGSVARRNFVRGFSNTVRNINHNLAIITPRPANRVSLFPRGNALDTARHQHRISRNIYNYNKLASSVGKRLVGLGGWFPNTGRSNINAVNTSKSVMSRSRKRKRSRMTGKSSSAIARLALSKVRKLEEHQEVKHVDQGLVTLASISSSGVVTPFAVVAQGDGPNNRDGDTIFAFRFVIRFQWRGVPADVLGVYRTIIFQDRRQVDSTTPPVLDVLSDTSPLANFKASTRTRFNILFDELYTRPSDTTSQQSFVRSLSLKMKSKIRFKGSAGTAVVSNGLYMINITNLTANQPSMQFYSRMFYND